jgi:cyclohexadienyl dehydratase
MKFFIPLLAILLLLPPKTATAEEPLFRLIDARLALMRAVAAHKWQFQLAVEDSAREAIVVEKARQSAIRAGIVPDTAEAFFRNQIEAAKEIQRYWFTRWEQGLAPETAPDLNSEIRPQLITLGHKITLHLSSMNKKSNLQSEYDATVSVEGLSQDRKDALYQSLLNIEQYTNRLQQILDTKTLRIGTTGDYAPFSYWPDDAPLPLGIDIELAQSLSDRLDVEAVFIRTSWPTLIQDLVAGEYDIAMSGVSLTEARKEFGEFSHPYHIGGKTPVARCEDKDLFGSLAAIDRESVTVIVNPGGTNQQFLDANIHRAKKILHQDNRDIFEQIINRKADVMITDRIEVQLQAALNPELCATMPNNLSYQEKAYLMPVDPALTNAVNQWLDSAMTNGIVLKAFEKNRRTGAEATPSQ